MDVESVKNQEEEVTHMRHMMMGHHHHHSSGSGSDSSGSGESNSESNSSNSGSTSMSGSGSESSASANHHHKHHHHMGMMDMGMMKKPDWVVEKKKELTSNPEWAKTKQNMQYADGDTAKQQNDLSNVNTPAEDAATAVKRTSHCKKQANLIRKLIANISKRETKDSKSPSLLDARELLNFLQNRYSQKCGGEAIEPKKKQAKKGKSLSWWWPSPPDVINKMFKVAKLQPGEVVYDLGCGDGRIPIQAAKRWGCTGVGVDFDENLVKEAKKRATRWGVQDKVEIRHGDALQVDDLHKADLVSLYILDRGMKLIKPILQSKLKKGARVVSHNYKFKGWKPAKTVITKDREGHNHWIYLYNI